jgi:hypothetical protein
VSIHGAALSLAMFMQSGSNVLEFRKTTDHINNMYYSLCDAVNVNYHYLRCDFTEVASHANSFDLYVDIAMLQQTVLEIQTH